MAPASASGQAAGQAPGTTAPVVVSFPQAGVPLVEAVRLTLEHQPSIDLSEAAVSRQEGVVQEQRGTFDWTLASRWAYSYRQQELPEARKEIERNKRANIAKNIDENRANAQRATSLSNALGAIPQNAGASDAQIAAIAAIDQPLASQLRILDVLIANATNANVATQLRGERNTLITGARNELISGANQFTTAFRQGEEQLQKLGEAPSDELFYNFNGSVQLSKAFRNGIALTPFLQGGMEGTNFLDKPRDAERGGKGVEPIYTIKVGFSATVPLMRNRGSVATGGAERAASIELDATRLALRHQADLSAVETARAYWDLRAAQASIEVAERSMKNQQRMVELTRAQLQAGNIPAIEVSRVQASEARSRARFEDASRSLQEAQVRLVDVMGLSASDDPATMPRAADDFPSTPTLAELATPLVSAIATGAGTRRNDLQAAVISEQAGRSLTDTLRTFTRSKLDFTTKVWWTALDDLINFVQDPNDPTRVARIQEKEGYGGIFDRWVGPSVETSLDYEKPLGNNVANGRLAQQRAELRRREITSGDLRRTIRLGVLRTARTLAESIDRVRAAEDAVKFYDTTIQGDLERLKAGDVTVLDTIVTEEQQVDAFLSLISARRDVARLLAELRFESGQLLQHQAGKPPAMDRAALTTVPPAGAK